MGERLSGTKIGPYRFIALFMGLLAVHLPRPNGISAVNFVPSPSV